MTPQTEQGLQEQQAEIGRAYREVFVEHPSGRVVLAHLLRDAGLLLPMHVPGDPHGTAYADGRRSLALGVLQQLRWTELETLELANARAPGRPGRNHEYPPVDDHDDWLRRHDLADLISDESLS